MKNYILIMIVTTIVYTTPCVVFGQKVWDKKDNLWYQKNTTVYIQYLSKEYGIHIEIPKNFIDLHKYYVVRRIREDRRVGSLYGPIFRTRDKKCIVMYPAKPIYITKEDKEIGKKTIMINRVMHGDTSTILPVISTSRFTRGQITGEVKAASGLYDNSGKPLTDSVRFHFDDHVTIIAGKKPRKMFNADTMYIYVLPLQKPRPKEYIISPNVGDNVADSSHAPLRKPNEKEYAYRIGLALEKKGRGSMIFKLFLTSKAKKEVHKYIHMLAKHVWYDKDFKGSKR